MEGDMNICFIGGGNMADALIGGLLKQSYKAEQLRVVEINADSRAKLHNKYGVTTTGELAAGVADSHLVVLAVKPQQMREVAAQLAPLLGDQLIISIAAGIRASDLARWLGTRNILRTMPNTPALIQRGVSGLYALPEVSPVNRQIAENILQAVGVTVWLDDETMMDSITAISGSGPAYVFYFIESLQQAARELGFTEADARSLAINTFVGAAQLALDSQDDVSVLRARVTSKNGTTERALLSMEANQVKQHIISGAKAAAARAKEMGDELGAA
jgi:pyrroline-5-carboxylate reductase